MPDLLLIGQKSGLDNYLKQNVVFVGSVNNSLDVVLDSRVVARP